MASAVNWTRPFAAALGAVAALAGCGSGVPYVELASRWKTDGVFMRAQGEMLLLSQNGDLVAASLENGEDRWRFPASYGHTFERDPWTIWIGESGRATIVRTDFVGTIELSTGTEHRLSDDTRQPLMQECPDIRLQEERDGIAAYERSSGILAWSASGRLVRIAEGIFLIHDGWLQHLDCNTGHPVATMNPQVEGVFAVVEEERNPLLAIWLAPPGPYETLVCTRNLEVLTRLEGHWNVRFTQTDSGFVITNIAKSRAIDRHGETVWEIPGVALGIVGEDAFVHAEPRRTGYTVRSLSTGVMNAQLRVPQGTVLRHIGLGYVVGHSEAEGQDYTTIYDVVLP